MKRTMKRLLSSLKRMDRITQVKPKPVSVDRDAFNRGVDDLLTLKPLRDALKSGRKTPP